MYHGVGHRSARHDPYNLFVSAGELGAHLSYLLGRGWSPMTLDEYLAGAPGPRRFLVTFDDGYLSVHDIALPLLASLRVPATVFVCSGLLGGASHWMPELAPEPLISAEQVLALRAGGFDIGLHGLDHTLLPGLPATELHRQTFLAAQRLADVTGRWPLAFAYPAGAHDAASRAAVAAAGMRVAFATHCGGGPFAVRRIDVNSTDTILSFRLKTVRGYPAMRRAVGALPGLRPALHAMIGSARREP
jgi:peptidoglycan/xylan/chitin deacetylase (PgdA/CDA1 family)